MILPIVGYGSPVLRAKAKNIASNYPNLSQLIDNMYDTMYNAHGVGLAAPQIGLDIRLFIVDGTPMDKEDKDPDTPNEDMSNFKKVFINPTIIEQSGQNWAFNEGCLSIPDIREDISRKQLIHIQYFDQHWVQYTETYSGTKARIIQHEYDHLEGVLFTDYLSPLKKQLIYTKLQKIQKGTIHVGYPMKFAKSK